MGFNVILVLIYSGAKEINFLKKSLLKGNVRDHLIFVLYY
jgi:hypothetical protein